MTIRHETRQRGFTLTEMMISLVLGALVVLAATAMVVSSRATYRTQDEATRLAENGRFAVELLSRQIRQAGYTDFGDSTTPPPSFAQDVFWNGNVYYDNSSNIGGADNASINFANAINGSDVLLTWYYGSGPVGGAADGNITDCAGFGVANPAANPGAYSNGHVRMVFEVVPDTDGEPSLGCRRDVYDPTTGQKAQAITGDVILVRGVESFQVLYGEAIYAAGADPDLVPPISIVYRQGQGATNVVSNWLNVVSVRFALLLRSNVGAQSDTTPQTYSLFGPSIRAATIPGRSSAPRVCRPPNGRACDASWERRFPPAIGSRRGRACNERARPRTSQPDRYVARPGRLFADRRVDDADRHHHPRHQQLADGHQRGARSPQQSRSPARVPGGGGGAEGCGSGDSRSHVAGMRRSVAARTRSCESQICFNRTSGSFFAANCASSPTTAVGLCAYSDSAPAYLSSNVNFYADASGGGNGNTVKYGTFTLRPSRRRSPRRVPACRSRNTRRATSSKSSLRTSRPRRVARRREVPPAAASCSA